MRIYVICDMEGITGVTDDTTQTIPGSVGYQKARQLLMSDLKAMLAGIKNETEATVILYDMHYYGRNIIIDELPENVRLISGAPKNTYKLFDRFKGFDVLFLLGFHSKGGTSNGLLPHTYDMGQSKIMVNGMEVGEIGLETLIAGQYNIPLAFISGDLAGVKEAKKISPNVETAVVKKGINKTSAICYPATYTRKLITEKAAMAIKRLPKMKPIKMSGPYNIKIFFEKVEQAEELATNSKVKRHDDYTVSFSGSNLHKLWVNKYWLNKVKD